MEIVSCHFKEDLGWLERSPYPVHVVGKEGGDTHALDRGKFASVQVVPNFANETGSYLWYIANNYDNLPERMAFIHGHETSGHQRMPVFDAIRNYGNLPFADLNRFMNFYCLFLHDSTYQYRKLWGFLLEPFLGPCPKVVNFRGMAQFSVCRDVVKSRPKEFWEFLYDRTRDLCDSRPRTYVMGCFYEAVWHLIFGVDSPLEDESRTNLAQLDGDLVCGRIGDDYMDIYMDSNLKVYGPWGFIKKLSEISDESKPAAHM